MSKQKDRRIREAQGQKSRQTARLNELRVLQALVKKPLSFSELLKETGFSKPVLAKHLKTWTEQNVIYKDTIKLAETTDATEIGKIVYKSITEEITPDIAAAIESALQIPKAEWDEESKAELKKHIEEIAKIISNEWDKLRIASQTEE